MRTPMIALLAITTLSACAPESGNYAGVSDARNEQMAIDTAQKLGVLYPPASTHILLSQATSDAYGQALEKKLREDGYAVEENDGFSNLLESLGELPAAPASGTLSSSYGAVTSSAADVATYAAAPVTPVTVGTPAPADIRNVAVSYVVDDLGGNLYRVKVTVDTSVLSRVYTISKNRFGPAGAWALRM